MRTLDLGPLARLFLAQAQVRDVAHVLRQVGESMVLVRSIRAGLSDEDVAAALLEVEGMAQRLEHAAGELAQVRGQCSKLLP